jgi:DNA-binding NtrC family response regulator
MLRDTCVLLLTHDELQARNLQELLREHVILTQARSLPDLREHLRTRQFDALFCDGSFYINQWQHLLQDIREHDPALPVIVLSRTGGEKEWVEVIEAGAFDLLVPPYYKPVVLSVVVQAAASHEARTKELV